jgi:thiol-disulfide isomerase/thioredoxin
MNLETSFLLRISQPRCFLSESREMPYPPSTPRILQLFALSFLICAMAGPAEQPLSADHVLATAKSAAVAQHKPIFLDLGASWCPPCRQMEAFMGDPKIHPNE